MRAVDLEQLQLFLKTCETGNISAAARGIGLSASIATRKIAALEAEIGARLMNRTTRKVVLTPAGQILKDWASGFLRGLDAALDDIAAEQLRPSGLVRLACTDFIAMTYLPEFLINFRGAYPNIDVSILTIERAVKVMDENFDLAIHSGLEPDGFVIGRKMWDIQTVLCASPQYVARHGAPSHPDELAGHQCIVHAIFESESWNFIVDGKIVGHRVRSNVRSTNAIFQKELVMRGLGVTNISRRIVSEELADGRLVEIMPDYRCVLPNGQLMATWIVFPHRDMLYRTRIFVDALMRHFQGLAA